MFVFRILSSDLCKRNGWSTPQVSAFASYDGCPWASDVDNIVSNSNSDSFDNESELRSTLLVAGKHPLMGMKGQAQLKHAMIFLLCLSLY